MADLTDFQVTDDVTDNLASLHNRLLGGNLRAEFVNIETISATKELADSDCPFQIITAGSTDRTVELAPEATTNHVTLVYNTTPSSDGYNVLVKDDSGGTTYATLAPDEWSMFIPFSGEGWKVHNRAYGIYKAGFSASHPADGTTYFFGSLDSVALNTTATNRKIPILRSGTIRKISLILIPTTSAGTTETSTLSFRLNDTTDTTITSAANLSALYEVTANVNIAVSSGDWGTIKWVTPTWSTNPTGVVGTALLYVTDQ